MPLEVRARDPDGDETTLTSLYQRVFLLPPSVQVEAHGDAAAILPVAIAEGMGAAGAPTIGPILPQGAGAAEAIVELSESVSEAAGEADRLVNETVLAREGQGDATTHTLPATLPQTEGAAEAVASLGELVSEAAGAGDRLVNETILAQEGQGDAPAHVLPFTLPPEADGAADAPNLPLTSPEREGGSETIALLIPLTFERVGHGEALAGLAPVMSENEGHATTLHFFQHTSEDGANAQTETGPNGAWTNPGNSTGKKDGALATISGQVGVAKDRVLELAYADFAGLSGFTIRTVRLHFYVRQTGTAANNGSLTLRVYDGTTATQLELITSDVDNLTTPRTFDVTSILNTWAKIDAGQARVRFQSTTVQTFSAAVDAVHLEVIADKTV